MNLLSSPSVAVVGATGLVGRTMLRLLEERRFPARSVKLLASKRSAGKKITFAGRKLTVEELTASSFEGIDIALFSAGGSTSRQFAPIAAAAGAVVIDNSSAWRMEKGVPLVVPEVNPGEASKHKGIIANPNCSTIQLVVPLKAMHDTFGLKRVVVSTYQSVSGIGQSGVDQLMAELKGKRPEAPAFTRQAAFNTIFHDFIGGSESTEEETKMMRESRKILGLKDLAISVTCVRIPTTGAHAESVNVTLDKPATPARIRALLTKTPGVIVMDDPASDLYPTVLDAADRDEIFVGRIRKDASAPNTFNMWIVSDNRRKGAATNALQIAELLLEKGEREKEREGKGKKARKGE